MNTPDLTALLARCRAGDTAAIETLVTTHQTVVYRFALSVLDDAAEADEATQDAFLAALRALETYRGEAAFTTWLYTITLNVCRGRLRQRQTRDRLMNSLQRLFRLTPHTPSPEAATVRQETSDALWQAIMALSEKHRLPIVFRYYHDLPVAEIAAILDISEGTVHSRLNTARERLRVALAGQPLSLEDSA